MVAGALEGAQLEEQADEIWPQQGVVLHAEEMRPERLGVTLECGEVCQSRGQLQHHLCPQPPHVQTQCPWLSGLGE